MNVSLTPELEAYVSGKVASGRYTSASEVMREALRLLEDAEAGRAARLATFHAQLSSRIKRLDHEGALEAAVVRDGLKKRSMIRRKKTA